MGPSCTANASSTMANTPAYISHIQASSILTHRQHPVGPWVHTPAVWPAFRRMDMGKGLMQALETGSELFGRELQGPRCLGYSLAGGLYSGWECPFVPVTPPSVGCRQWGGVCIQKRPELGPSRAKGSWQGLSCPGLRAVLPMIGR